MPEVQALAERVGETVGGATLEGFDLLQFSSLKTVTPRPRSRGAAARGGRPTGEVPGPRLRGRRSDARAPLARRPARHRGAAEVDEAEGVRGALPLRRRPSLLVKEFGKERKAGVWSLAAGDEGPLAALGPEVLSDEAADLLPGEHRRPPGPHDPAGSADRRGCGTWLLRRRAPPCSALAVRGAREAGHRGTRTAGRRSGRSSRRARGGAAPQRGPPDQARGSLHRPRSLGAAVPSLRRRPPSCLLRVPRGHVLPRLPDRRQGPRRSAPVPSHPVASGRVSDDRGLPDDRGRASAPGTTGGAAPRVARPAPRPRDRSHTAPDSLFPPAVRRPGDLGVWDPDHVGRRPVRGLRPHRLDGDARAARLNRGAPPHLFPPDRRPARRRPVERRRFR